MRTLLYSLIAAGLMAAPVAQAQCVRTAEQSALDVAWLKSQLMVTAITCKQEDKYNAFIQRFRPDLVSAEQTVKGYFQRAHGRRSQAQHDDYNTQLAQSQAQLNLRQGNQFCNRSSFILDEVQALRTGEELAEYAAAKGVAHPIAISACGAGPEPRTTTTASSSSTRRASTTRNAHRS